MNIKNIIPSKYCSRYEAAIFSNRPQARSACFTSALFLILTLLLPPATLHAQEPTTPVTAAIALNKANVYKYETFFITLTITTTGIQIRPKMDIKNLPDSRKIRLISQFENLPVQRKGSGHSMVEIHRYRCRARSITPGVTDIAPTLHLVVLQRKRALIGSYWEERPISVQIPAIKLITKHIPPPPHDFSGAIGELNFSASIYPTDIAEGDLVTLTTKISGIGYTDNIKHFESKGSDNLKVYEPKKIGDDRDLLTYNQVVIPQSTNITAIPKIGLTYFDTRSAKYKRITQGPFPLTYHTIQAEELQQFKPDNVQPETNKPKQPPEHNQNLWKKLMQKMGHARYEQTTLKTATEVHLAPSKASLKTFKIPANTEIRIITHHNNWLQIEQNQKRGWIYNNTTE